MDLERLSYLTGLDSGLSIDVVQSAGGPVRLTVHGELDRESADDLSREVRMVVSTPPVIELDLTGVTFMDSAGIRCLLTCQSMVERSGGRLVVTQASARVIEVLRITGLLSALGLPDRG